jgi:DNA-binding GntR family transcriptional regulator
MTDTNEQKSSGGKTLVDFAYTHIRKDITAEMFKPGVKIRINELCERYKISQTPIKQALNRLIMAGLVENVPQRGYRIRRITGTEIDEIFEIRLMMELTFIPKVIRAVNSNSLLQEKFETNLRDNLALARDYSTTEDFLQTYALDQEFHELYVLAGGNHTALRMHKTLNTHAYAYYLYGKQPKEKTITGILEHRNIYESLKEGNEAIVREQLIIHSQNAREIISLSLKLDKFL